ncbi:MAG TPA: hypothetical protein VEQ58_11195 [Polyangiaceae bacterium]|nr:hypothetical protein [Polyangiaceae bacterium]
MKATEAVRRSAPFISILALGACTSVLGIEDVHPEPRDGSGGSSNGDAGTSNAASGKTNTAGSSDGSGAKTSSGGNTNTSGSTSTGGGGKTNQGDTGGSTTSAGADTGGTSAGGSGNSTTGPVHGRLIDFWGNGLNNITVQIGTEQVATDKDGKFAVESDVPLEYDASLKITRNEGDKVYGWVYQGLTRRDPTLQVFQGLEDRGTSGTATVTSNVTVGTNDTITGAWGTTVGSRQKKDMDAGDPGNNFTPDWQGAASVSGTAHALLWSKNPANDLPAGYKSYDHKLIALAEGNDASMGFTFDTMMIPSDNITGTVTPVGNGDRTNAVFVRFASGASMELANHTPSTDTFSYLVPQLTDGSISVAASEEDSSGGYSVVHKDGLSPGDSVGTLVIPAPPVTLGPTGSAAEAVDDKTTLSFRGSADSSGAYVVHIEAKDYYEALFIVTQKTSFTLPKVLDGAYALTSGRVYRWWVETHGSAKTVDQLARAGGFADSYCGPTQWLGSGEPAGTSQDSGSFTTSGLAAFTLK